MLKEIANYRNFKTTVELYVCISVLFSNILITGKQIWRRKFIRYDAESVGLFDDETVHSNSLRQVESVWFKLGLQTFSITEMTEMPLKSSAEPILQAVILRKSQTSWSF